jgi:glyoxylase-like metal-dependent hydrolase (beta-lactamase superfamily II)
LDGQKWTTLGDLQRTHRNLFREEEEGLVSFWTEPKFAIGQRALFIRNPEGNLLWDCLSLLDDATVGRIESLGGLKSICISHPHYYSSVVEWSRAFGGVPVYLHCTDARWVMRPDGCIEFWESETKPLPGGFTLIRCGGHFNGATVLHWPAGAGGKGVLLTGDTIQVVPDRRSVSFMYSYPNYIPLCAATVQHILRAVEPFVFDRIYGAFPQLTISGGSKAVLARSGERYIRAINGEWTGTAVPLTP